MLHYLQEQVLPERSVQGREILLVLKSPSPIAKSTCSSCLFFRPMCAPTIFNTALTAISIFSSSSFLKVIFYAPDSWQCIKFWTVGRVLTRLLDKPYCLCNVPWGFAGSSFCLLPPLPTSDGHNMQHRNTARVGPSQLFGVDSHSPLP